MRKILVAVDDSPVSLKAVEHAGRSGSGGDLQISLVHVSPNLPAGFWDDGHILSEAERVDHRKVINQWLSDREAKMVPIFKKASDLLTAMGVNPNQIQTKSVSDSTDIADTILEEARKGGYQEIVVGRCDRKARHILGSVSSKIVLEGRGMAVTVVE